MHPTSLSQLLAMGAEHHRAGRPIEAGRCGTLVLDAFPEQPDALYLTGVAAFRRGDIPAGLSAVARALALNPALGGARADLMTLMHEALQQSSNHLGEGRWRDYFTVFAAVLEARAVSACSTLMRRYFPLNPTESLLAALDYADSLRSAGAVVETFFDARLVFAFRLAEHGRLDEAADAFLALAGTTGDEDVRLRLATLLVHYRRSAAAMDLLVPMTENGGVRRAGALHLLGKARYALDDLTGAETALHDAVAHDPRCFAAAIDLGALHLTTGRAEDAEAAFRSALTVPADLPWAELGLALALTMQGRKDEALAIANGAVAAAPEMVEGHVLLGSLKLDRGQATDALENFRTAINLRVGQQFSPMPPGPRLYESMRGYSDALYRHLAEVARTLSKAVVTPVAIEGESYVETPVLTGRLTPLADIPGDGAFHVRDPAGRIATKRIRDAEVLDLAPPGNLTSPGEEIRLFRSPLFDWLDRAYQRYSWPAKYPFPRHTGSDGVFLSRIDGARLTRGWLLSTVGDFLDESTVFDELVLFGSALGNGGFKTGDDGGHVLRFLHPPTRFSAPHAILTGYHSVHYGSWLVNILPKVLHFAAQTETRDLPLALPYDLFARGFVQETLDALGVARERLVILGNGTFEFDTAYAVTAGAHLMTPEAPALVRERLLAGFGIASRGTPGERLFYISRRDANVRRVLNEDDLIALLDRYGVEVVVNVGLSMPEIAHRFAEARCVLGVNGAGMINTLFCAPGTTVIELCNDTMIEPLYWMTGNALGLHHHMLVEPTLNRRGDFVVSLSSLERLLRRVL